MVDQATLGQSVERIRSDGFVLLENLCSEEMLKQLAGVAIKRLQELQSALGNREIGIGSAAGYVEICQRSPGRWDAPISPEEFGFEPKGLPWRPLVATMLGEDAEFTFSGVVSSEPNTPAQQWHIDSPHEAAELLPLHAIQVIIAIEDIPLEMGPTELTRGSQVQTNHFSVTSLLPDEMVYQHQGTTPESLVRGTQYPVPESVKSALPAGTCIAFDDRILHRGLANKSNKHRHVVYFSYRRKGYSVNTHFESDRSVFDEIS